MSAHKVSLRAQHPDLTPPGQGGRHRRGTLKTAYATIKGFEVMRALRKAQASAFNATRDIRGEARIVERAFGLGGSALSELVQLLHERLQLEAA